MNIRTAILLFLLVPAAAFADLAPSVYDGISIFPVTNTDISMREEIVDIFVSDDANGRYICDVRADFIMENSTDRRIDILVGFPLPFQPYVGEGTCEMTMGAAEIKDDYYRFSAKANGVPVDSISASKVRGKVFSERADDCSWFGWGQSFSPGTTRIEVEYSFVTTPDVVYSAAMMGHSLHTGSLWKGPIGRAVIVVHFPPEMDREFIFGLKPEGYVIDDGKVLWDFKNFEPGAGDSIRAGFMQFDVIKEIETARSKCASAPNDAEYKTELAEAYLRTIGNHRKMLSPSWKLDWVRAEDFERLLGEVEDKEDVAFLESIFRSKRQPDNEGHEDIFYIRDEERANDFPRLEKILTDIKFKQRLLNGIDYISKAEKLILEILEEDPQNCYVWNLYLSHFFKILPGSWGPITNSIMNEIIPLQRQQIEKACKCCPGDPGIALWKDHLDNIGPDFLNAVQYIEEAKGCHTLWVKYPNMGYLQGRSISPGIINVLLNIYEISDTIRGNYYPPSEKGVFMRIYLRPRNEPIPDQIKASISEITGWRLGINHRNSIKISNYNLSAGIY